MRLIKKSIALLAFTFSGTSHGAVPVTSAIHEIQEMVRVNSLRVRTKTAYQQSYNMGQVELELGESGNVLNVWIRGKSANKGWNAESQKELSSIDFRIVSRVEGEGQASRINNKLVAGYTNELARESVRDLIREYFRLKFQARYDKTLDWPVLIVDGQSFVSVVIDDVRGTEANLKAVFQEIGEIAKLFSRREQPAKIVQKLKLSIENLKKDKNASVVLEDDLGAFKDFFK